MADAAGMPRPRAAPLSAGRCPVRGGSRLVRAVPSGPLRGQPAKFLCRLPAPPSARANEGIGAPRSKQERAANAITRHTKKTQSSTVYHLSCVSLQVDEGRDGLRVFFFLSFFFACPSVITRAGCGRSPAEAQRSVLVFQPSRISERDGLRSCGERWGGKGVKKRRSK